MASAGGSSGAAQGKLRVVVKIGTSSVLQSGSSGATQLALVHLATTVEVLWKLRAQGHDVVLVSSGAVGAGCTRVGFKERPSELSTRQALAAIGQVHLVAKYDVLFSSLGLQCAQVLLTYENFLDRVQFLNARNTFEELFRMGAIPIVNENDPVGVQEIKADNDKLACMVSNMIGADLVFLMTDVNGVYTANPRTDPNAKRLELVDDFDKLRAMCKLGSGDESEWGTGGMAAKITAASLATSLGVRTVIMHADDCPRIPLYVEKELAEKTSGSKKGGAKAVQASASASNTSRFDFGTTFERSKNPPRERKRWIRSLQRRGTIVVDDGARQAVQGRNTLFAAGVISVEGNFTAFESVVIAGRDGTEVACGLCSLDSSVLRQVKGLPSERIYELFGQSGTVIERGNMDVYMAKNKSKTNLATKADTETSDDKSASDSANTSFVPPDEY
ncbi:Delta-1-pyrroline-5-carboxylate synthase 1 [Hondaea fermentalgiana]|uniref:Delta-1-pyrroline-5-carboxylate synthase 1 n=1 Tax=Hondaea fermentalgiana TaxID=2315210 RepID=A0A2R5GTJ1_9STRA|nr:Delta-1-pyrroline-5-carboxylate synthase 1 [Hondaea fermentalgiana]|eukprot:GBG34187.1 Delta-1-pyrroline-5-carboxylate synthase 1 [Hondaea fermentalgiana]